MAEENDNQTADHVEEAVPDTEIATTVSDVPPDFGSPEVADFPDVAFGEIDADEDEDETPDPGEPEEDDDDGGSEEPVALDQAEPEEDDDAEEDEPVLPPPSDEEEAEAGPGA
jgi:hypothetical protein